MKKIIFILLLMVPALVQAQINYKQAYTNYWNTVVIGSQQYAVPTAAVTPTLQIGNSASNGIITVDNTHTPNSLLIGAANPAAGSLGINISSVDGIGIQNDTAAANIREVNSSIIMNSKNYAFLDRASVGLRALNSTGTHNMESTVGFNMYEVTTTPGGYSIERIYGDSSNLGPWKQIALMGDSTAFTYGFRNYTNALIWDPYRTDLNYLHQVTGNILVDAGNVNANGLIDRALLNSPFIATNATGQLITSAYVPYNPASYPVNAGGETLGSVAARNNSSTNMLRITGQTINNRTEVAAEIYQNSGIAVYSGYDGTNNISAPAQLVGGNTAVNFNRIQVDKIGMSLIDKSGVTQATIDSVGDGTFNGIVKGSSIVDAGVINAAYIGTNSSGQLIAAATPAPATGGSGYIQNQFSAQQPGAGFWTAGNGRIDGYEQVTGDSLVIWSKSYSSAATLNSGFRLMSNMGITNSQASISPSQGVDLYTSETGIEYDNTFNISSADNRNTITALRADFSLNSTATNLNQTAPLAAFIPTIRAFNTGIYTDIASIRIQDPFTFTQAPYTAFTGTIQNWYGLYIDSTNALSIPSARITNKYGIYESGTMPNHYQGGVQYPIRTTTISTTITSADYTVINTSGTNTFTIPTAASSFRSGSGQIFHLVCNAGGITTSISFNNLSGTAVTAIAAGAAATIQSDGTNWRQIQ